MFHQLPFWNPHKKLIGTLAMSAFIPEESGSITGGPLLDFLLVFEGLWDFCFITYNQSFKGVNITLGTW